MIDEIPLSGGHTTIGIVKIENTVHRPIGQKSEFVHSLLRLLEKKKFLYSPRFIGIDEKGREILTFIKGEVFRGENWNEKNLIIIAEILRKFHDATEGSGLVRPGEIVCHNDFAPWNIILNNSVPVGIIDFDDAAPGNRIDEFAYFAWTFLNLGDEIDVNIQAEKMKLLCGTYSLSKKRYLIDALLGQQEKILQKRRLLAKNSPIQTDREFSKSRINEIINEIKWVKKHRNTLESAFI